MDIDDDDDAFLYGDSAPAAAPEQPPVVKPKVEVEDVVSVAPVLARQAPTPEREFAA